MEIWITKGDPKVLKKDFPFLKFYLVVNIFDICKKIGYTTSLNQSIYGDYLINSELKKKLSIVSKSKKFYRVLLVLEELRENIAEDILEFSLENNLKFNKIYLLEEGKTEFELKAEQ